MNMVPHFNSKFWIPESNFSGVIEAVGSDVDRFKVGDAVFGCPDPKKYLQRGTQYNGVMAEYAILPANQAVKKPDNISFDAAAGLAGNGCTALQFCEKAGIKKGDRVLVTAASGGLGSIAVQIVRTFVGESGSVIGVCSAANAELVRSLGADEVIDYKSHPQIHEYLTERYSSKPLNVIIDIAGADDTLYLESPRYLAPDGIFLAGGKMDITHGGGGFLSILSFLVISHLRMYWLATLGGTPRTLMFHSGHITQASMRKLPELVQNGQLRGLVDSEWAMEDAIKAYERVATRRARGMVVVRVQEV
ncbi:hypothetical protein PV04_02106 [Phialophora macrospora]|uniref:Enoyl reductase (ER) domain-containing protein n=1 Tax=Phialophora macrospora TaxID=1851006 RepID=A0A0D2FZU9_9EURO|nr:hypothetical protein PV04_02106 [Phialophora macrospora]